MNEQIELGWLRLSDKSDLVLTSLHVFQYRNRGTFGEVKTMVPLPAITTVAIVFGSFIADSAEMPSYLRDLFSSSVVSVVQYGSLLGAIGIFVLFWFYKQNEIQIITSTGTLGGIPKSYQDAQKFCDLLVSGIKEPLAPGERDEKEPEGQGEEAESEWHL
jgi:hypothetical protein